MARERRPEGTLLLVLLSLVFTCRSRNVESTPPPPPRQDSRPAVHAGSWYPGDEEGLRRALRQHLGERRAEPGEPILALVAPHAGLKWSGPVAAAVYAQLAAQKVARVFLLGPSHHQGFSGVALPSERLSGYETPLGELPIDQEAVAALRGQSGFGGPARAHLPEHSLEMQAIFVAATHPRARLVPLVVGRIANAAAARQIAGTLLPLLGPGDVVLVSSDFTHYGPRFGYTPFFEQIPQRLDAAMDRAYDLMRRRDLSGFNEHLAATGDTICGSSPIQVLLALLPEDATAREVARDTSGGMTGDFSHSVSYLSVAWRRTGGWQSSTERHGFRKGQQVLDQNEQRQALLMARKTLESYLTAGKVPNDDHLDVPATGPFRDTLSVFVTLKKEQRLRGCIGHLLPTQPLWQDIRDNAISAAVRDKRFPAVTATELGELNIEISVLSPLRDISGPESFDVGHHGIILSAHGRRAVFLPQVALEQGWDRDATLTHLARKAGLSHDAWRSDAASFQVFEAQLFAEPE